MSRFQLKKHSLYQEPGRSQTEWKKRQSIRLEMTEMLELADKDFKAAIIRMLW